MGEIEELVQTGQTLMDEGEFLDALGFFEQALLLNQNDPDLWNNKAMVNG